MNSGNVKLLLLYRICGGTIFIFWYKHYVILEVKYGN